MKRSMISLALGSLLALALMNVGCGEEAQPDESQSSALSAPHEKVTICHATGSATNPYVEITVSVNAIPAHEAHQDGRDIIPAPADGCPGAPPPPCDCDCDCDCEEDCDNPCT